jgi:hypothetical protein
MAEEGSKLKVKIGKAELEVGGPYLQELRDSNDLLGDWKALQQRMATDGYLLIRGLHDRDKVLQAREEMLRLLSETGRLAPDTPLEEGRIGPDNKGALFNGIEPPMPKLLEVVNSNHVMQFFNHFFGGPSLTYDYKWVRAVGHQHFTGAHYDIVYMGRGTRNLYTMWTPLGDISLEMGGLAVLLGSQHLEKVKETYGNMDVDRDNIEGWFSNDPLELVEKFGGVWATTEYKAGDAIIFGMFTMHGSLTNQTNRYRLSVDTRYQLASEPADERWIGAKPKGHYAWGKGKMKSMEEARRDWGI